MIINNATASASFVPSSISQVTGENAKQLVGNVQNSQNNQSSTIVQLSTQGQLLSRSDQPGSLGESTESQIQESSESPSVQFMEGELGNNASASQMTASNGVSAYLKVAAA